MLIGTDRVDYLRKKGRKININSDTVFNINVVYWEGVLPGSRSNSMAVSVSTVNFISIVAPVRHSNKVNEMR